eukprot:5200400-Prorocentrum_lima.AAC.1
MSGTPPRVTACNDLPAISVWEQVMVYNGQAQPSDARAVKNLPTRRKGSGINQQNRRDIP